MEKRSLETVEVKNYVELQGLLQRPSFSGADASYQRFKASLSLPFSFKEKATGEMKVGNNYFNIIAWGEVATALSEVPEGSLVCVRGVLQIRAYDGNCKFCSSPDKRYWTEISVESYSVES